MKRVKRRGEAEETERGRAVGNGALLDLYPGRVLSAFFVWIKASNVDNCRLEMGERVSELDC